MRLLRTLLGLVLLFLLPAFGVACWQFLVQALSHSRIALPLGLGIVAGAALDHLLLKKVPGLETFEHELTHALVALLCFRRIRRFVVTRHEGGLVEHQGNFGGWVAGDLIGFAPYILPTFAMISVLFRPWIPSTYHLWFDGWIGITLGFHAWSTCRETAEAWTTRHFTSAGTGESVQSDLGRRGLIYSAVFIASTTLALHGLVFALLVKGYPGFGAWVGKVAPMIQANWRLIVVWTIGWTR